jgi:hypothetical protein
MPKSRDHRKGWAAIGVAVAVAIGSWLAVTLASHGVPPNFDSRIVPSAAIPPWNNWTCNPNNPSPAALDIPAANPTHSEAAGSVLTVTYEFRVTDYSKSLYATVLYLPTVKAILPTSPSGDLDLSVGGSTAKVSGGNWSSAHLLTATENLSSGVTFSSAKAYLTSSKLAVMADVASGALTLEFRWHWSFQPAGGGAVRSGAWTVPSANAISPFLPSVFYPAPRVTVTSTSPNPAASGTRFNLTVAGFVANTSFRMVLEYPNNGTEIQSIWENTSRVGSSFVTWLPLTYMSGTLLPAGSYLVHIHDVCEAIVYILPIKLTNSGPSWASTHVGSLIEGLCVLREL